MTDNRQPRHGKSSPGLLPGELKVFWFYFYTARRWDFTSTQSGYL